MHFALVAASSLDKSWIDSLNINVRKSRFTAPCPMPHATSTLPSPTRPGSLLPGSWYQSECIAIEPEPDPVALDALHARLRFLSSPLTLIGCFIAQLNRKTEILCIVTETIMTSVRSSRRTVQIPPWPKGKWIHWAYGSLTLLRFMSLPTILFLLFVNLQFDFDFKFSFRLLIAFCTYFRLIAFPLAMPSKWNVTITLFPL